MPNWIWLVIAAIVAIVVYVTYKEISYRIWVRDVKRELRATRAEKKLAVSELVRYSGKGYKNIDDYYDRGNPPNQKMNPMLDNPFVVVTSVFYNAGRVRKPKINEFEQYIQDVCRWILTENRGGFSVRKLQAEYPDKKVNWGGYNFYCDLAKELAEVGILERKHRGNQPRKLTPKAKQLLGVNNEKQV